MNTIEARERAPASVKALLWRFHFYVGVLVAPLLILTSLSGILYVFAPQIEEVAYARLLHVSPISGKPALEPDAQLAAFRQANPQARVSAFTPSFSPKRSSTVSFTRANGEPGSEHAGHEGHSTRGAESAPVYTAYLNPQTGETLGVLTENDRFQLFIKRFHKTYMAGENGRILTELGTSWLMVLLITGFILWFPNKARRIAGVWTPRLTGASRLRWRDFHSILGMYLLLITLVLCFTGLTWSRFSGNWRRSFQKAIGQESVFRFTPPKSAITGDAAPISLAQAVKAAETAGATAPYKITLPQGKVGSYGIQTFNDPPFTDSLTVFVDQYSGKVLNKKGRGDTPPIARLLGMGVAFHEGRLFGLANQLLCALGAGSIIFSVISGLVMWTKRSPVGGFKAPKAMPDARIPLALWLGFGVLGIFLPVAAASFVLIVLFDRLVLPLLT
ncbi:MAG: PepSY domain-containing protein [Armatimonas sp.]